MAKYLISFPSAAMVVPDGEWGGVGRDAHAVIDEAKAAGVYVFGGGIDEDEPPVREHPDIAYRMIVRLLHFACVLLFASLGITSPARAQNAFASVRCNGDIPKALIGKRSASGPVSVLERKHHDIGLKDEGATQISDTVTYMGWTICGHEYAILEDAHDRIRDAILFPLHTRRAPGFLGTCKRAGRPERDAILAVLANDSPIPGNRHYSPSDSATLPVSTAWKVDERHARFVVVPVGQLACPRSSIFTIDAGP